MTYYSESSNSIQQKLCITEIKPSVDDSLVLKRGSKQFSFEGCEVAFSPFQ